MSQLPPHPQQPEPSSTPSSRPTSPVQPAATTQQVLVAPPPRKRSGLKIVFVLLLALALLASVAINFANVSLFDLTSAKPRLASEVMSKGKDDQQVAVLNVYGPIGDPTVQLVHDFCRHARDDDKIKAVVLRVISPGGGIGACDQIHKDLQGLAQHKRITVSMGSVAASGGYYISMPAAEIFAEPTSITGSIGVIGAWPVLKDMLDKWGVRMVVVRSTHAEPWKAAQSWFEHPAPYQLEHIQGMMDTMQARFENVVKQGRPGKLKISTIERTITGPDGKPKTVQEVVPFNGNVWLGPEAMELGLVDQIGYLDDAVKKAADAAKLTEPKVVEYFPRRGLLHELGLTRAPAVDFKLLDELQTPRFMMMWKVDP